MRSLGVFPWVALAWLIASGSIPAQGAPPYRLQIHGRVSSSWGGEPLPFAGVLVWGVDVTHAPRLEAEGVADSDGVFNLTVETGRPRCLVYIYYDDPSTEGFDAVPAVWEVDSSIGLHTLDFTLEPASTVVLEGPLRLVDSSSNINEYRCAVLDPGSEKPIEIGSYRLVYGTGGRAQNQFLRLEPNVIIVPAERPFELRLSPSYLVERTTLIGWPWRRFHKIRTAGHRVLRIGEGDGLVLSRGELLRLDVRRYSIASDLEVLEGYIGNVERALAVKEEQGFYTVSERHEMARIRGLTDAASTTLSRGMLEEAYINARQAYLSARNLRSRLLGMELEASVSVKELVAFIALSSIALSYLLFDSRRRRVLFSTPLYALLLLYLYLIYPGSSVVSPASFTVASTVSLMAIFLFASLIPRLAGEVRLEEGLPFMAALGALFSMAKRSLLRRRLRFLFTLTSILILSMSFVALTSASTGYGLIYAPQEWAKATRGGLVVKQFEYAPASPLLKGRFHEVTDEIADWIGGRAEVVSVARKAESYPSLQPYGFIGDQPIEGILGIEPASEPILPEIRACLVEGEIPLEGEEAVLVSDRALRELGGAIGDTIAIGDVQLRVKGTFSRRIMGVRDINGELFVPNTMIDLTPSSGPTIVVQPCDYEGIVITTTELALKIHKDVHVSRVAASVGEGVDLINLAKSLALERGVRVWASTGGEVYSAHVGEYFLGKGLPILIPWVIVILNVFMTMVNAMYERRREMAILSSVGLNPSHITGIFVAEASITGVIGGGFGYLIGLGLYPLMAHLSSAPQVHQKISALWSLGAIGIAAAAAVVGVIFALRGSVVLTPSLERRWAVAGAPRSHREPWIIPIPSKIRADEIEDFMTFIRRSLMAHRERTSYPNITSIREGGGGAGASRSLSFWYREGDEAFYTAELRAFGVEKDIRRAGNFVRGLVIRWNTERKA